MSKIAIVDDHEFFRGGLKAALKRIKGVEISFEAENGKDFFEKMEKTPVDIVLLDIKMPIMDGYETTLKIREIYPELKILILSMYDSDEYVQKLLEAGVDGFILKNINKDNLEMAINYILNGKQFFSNELMPFFTKQIINKSENNIKNEITKRELQILKLIIDGHSNKEIAEKLYISVRTVTNHRASLNTKTGAKNTATLISYAIKHNLLQ